ncbi:unnamed protein product, partial [marine sediment metagenome]
EPLDMDLAATRNSPLTYRDTFLPNEQVWIAIDPAVQPPYVGLMADVYVVHHRTEAQWVLNTNLVEVGDGVETIHLRHVCVNCWPTKIWEPPLTPGEYDVVIDRDRDGHYNSGVDIIDSLDPVGFTVSEIRVDSISFNYPGSGVITIYDDAAGANITPPEYSSAASAPIKPAAWVRGGTRSVKVEFTAVSGISSAQIWAVNGLGGLTKSGTPQVTFTGNHGQGVFNVNTMPSAVGKHLFAWDWKYTVASTTKPIGRTGQHLVYTVLQNPIPPPAPIQPMPTPWLKLLDHACTWGSGSTTKEQVCTNLLNNGFSGHYTWNMDCHRLSSDFVRLISTQGITGSAHRWASVGCGAVDYMAYQRTKAIDPVGPTWGYGMIDWYWHQWAEAQGKQRDPSAAVSLSGNWGAYEDDLFF